MSQTLTRQPRNDRPLFHSNPVLSRLSKVTERVDTNAATYGLVFTVIWIYLKILDLLMQFAGKKDD